MQKPTYVPAWYKTFFTNLPAGMLVLVLPVQHQPATAAAAAAVPPLTPSSLPSHPSRSGSTTLGFGSVSFLVSSNHTQTYRETQPTKYTDRQRRQRRRQTAAETTEFPTEPSDRLSSTTLKLRHKEKRRKTFLLVNVTGDDDVVVAGRSCPAANLVGIGGPSLGKRVILALR